MRPLVLRAPVLRPRDVEDVFALDLRLRDDVDLRAPVFRLRDLDADFLAAPRPEPRFLPPPVVLLTVAERSSTPSE